VADSVHRPVLLAEAVELLAVKESGVYVDATLGGGGYTEAFLEAGAAKVIAFDWDREALERAGRRLAPHGSRAVLVRAGFQELEPVLAGLEIEAVDGIAADLGLSSDQLETGGRGFSFQNDGPLDMRMDQRLETTAADIVAQADEATLKAILGRLGQEPQGGRISRAILAEREIRPLETTAQLAELVSRVAGKPRTRSKKGARKKIHPATRTFMALRMAVNKELENLERLLEALPRVLKTGGRVAIVSYHSLEDRRVKESFRENSKSCTCPPGRPCVCSGRPRYRLLTRKPVGAGPSEVERNPRARSARLRAVERLSDIG
jgi:16S rRNA (cytosine1402-N4)-methyltransferase